MYRITEIVLETVVLAMRYNNVLQVCIYRTFYFLPRSHTCHFFKVTFSSCSPDVLKVFQSLWTSAPSQMVSVQG